MFGKCFKGVLTDVIEIENKNSCATYKVIKMKKYLNSIIHITNDKKYIIPIYDSTDSTIIEKISKNGNHFLTDANLRSELLQEIIRALLDTESRLKTYFNRKSNPVYAEPAQVYSL